MVFVFFSMTNRNQIELFFAKCDALNQLFAGLPECNRICSFG